MPLQIIRQDITKMQVDAIVNTTNEEMTGYSGVDLAVHKSAGPLLDAECAKIAEIALKLSDKVNAAMAYSMEGDVAYQQGDRKRAFKAYQNAIEVNPDYAPALNNSAYFLSEEKKSLKKAEKMSARTIELEPDNATYRDTYGWILFLLGRAEDAKPHFKHAMLYGGRDSSVVLEHYSKVLEALGETELSNYYKSLADYKKEQGK